MNVKGNQSDSQESTRETQPVIQDSASSSIKPVKAENLPQILRRVFPSTGNFVNTVMFLTLVAILAAIVSPDFRGAIGIRITSNGFEFNMDRR